MPIRKLSDVVSATHEQLEDAGVYDRFVDIDTSLHVDPHLLEHSEIPEMKSAYKNFETYWRETFKLVGVATGDTGVIARTAHKRFVFRELKEASLGYAKNDNAGSAIGVQLAEQLYQSAKAVLLVGITDPTFFELIGIFETGIGADRISDIVIRICLPDFLRYTQRVCADLNIQTKKWVIRGQDYLLPEHPDTKRFVLFFPKDSLRELPTALEFSEIEAVVARNEELRRKLGTVITKAMTDAAEVIGKAKRKEIILSNPELLQLLIREYKDAAAVPYDFLRDIAGERVWLTPATEATEKAPLDLSRYKPVTPEKVRDVVLAICDKFGDLVENNGLWKVLYDDRGVPRKEKVAQMLFFVIADCYATANGIDLSPEVNSGPGPVDFKFSFGKDAKVLVEIKLSTHTGIVKGFEKQLPKYAAAEKSQHDILLIVRNSDNDTQIRDLDERHSAAVRSGKKVATIKKVDGRRQKSASQLS
jgi:hypothetical protein